MGFMMENHLYFAIYKVLFTFSTFSSIFKYFNAMQIPCKHLDVSFNQMQQKGSNISFK